MSYNHRKDLKALVAKGRVGIHRYPSRLFYDIYLWESREALQAQANEAAGASACHNPGLTWYRYDEAGNETHHIPPKVGEMHFYRGGWDIEQVAHEVEHATLHLRRLYGPAEADMERDFQEEERVCYAHGRLVSVVYKWLWEQDPNSKWERKE